MDFLKGEYARRSPGKTPRWTTEKGWSYYNNTIRLGNQWRNKKMMSAGLPFADIHGFTLGERMRMGGWIKKNHMVYPTWASQANLRMSAFNGIPFDSRVQKKINNSFNHINGWMPPINPTSKGRPNGRNFNNGQFNKMVKFIGIDMLAQMGNDVAQRTGNKTLGAISNIISSGSSGALAGSFLGPKGVIIGAGLGIGKGIYDTVSGNSEDA